MFIFAGGTSWVSQFHIYYYMQNIKLMLALVLNNTSASIKL